MVKGLNYRALGNGPFSAQRDHLLEHILKDLKIGDIATNLVEVIARDGFHPGAGVGPLVGQV